VSKESKMQVGVSIIGTLIFCVFLYGTYWVAKNVSYAIFYEDMVQQTITEMVKPEYLKQ